MLKRAAVFLGVCIGFGMSVAPPAIAQTSFEGTLVMWDSIGGNQAIKTMYYFKGNKVRIEVAVSGVEVNYIEDEDAKTTTLIMPGQKTYTTERFSEAKTTAASAYKKPVKTGKTETIAGYACDEWTETDTGKATVDLWCARNLAIVLPSMGMLGQGDTKAKYEDFYKNAGFPLRMSFTDSTGKQIMRMETVEIEKKSLDDALFVPPADYTSTDASSGMKKTGK